MSELTVLVGVSESKVQYQSKEYVLTALKIADIADLEARFDASLEELFKDKKQMTVKIAYVIWLSMRRQGLTSEEIKTKAWKLQPEDVAEIFSIDAATKVMETIMGMSGMEFKAEKNVSSQPPV